MVFVSLNKSCSNSSGTTKLGGHTAYLPDRTGGTGTPDGFVASAPFYKNGYYHWHIRVSSRFECDDYVPRDRYSYDTIHRVFVRD